MAFKISISETTPEWDTLAVANLTYFPFEKGDYKPFTHGRLYGKDKAVHVQLICFEVAVVAEQLTPGMEMLKDSCVTFQINPCPQKSRTYLSVTCNEKGTAYALVCEENGQAPFSEKGLKEPAVRVLHGDNNMGIFWGVEYALSAETLQRIYGDIPFASGHILEGNILKSRFSDEKPHFGSFFPYEEETPGLFSRRSFGEFVLVRY